MKTDMTDMFKDCSTLISSVKSEFVFIGNQEIIKFTQLEIDKIKIEDPSFTFTGKDVKKVREETDRMMKKFYPECLL